MATFIGVCIFLMIALYGIYYPLDVSITLLQLECIALQKQVGQVELFHKSNQELAILIQNSKKNISDHSTDVSMREKNSHKHMLFILDTFSSLGLMLNTYSSCKEKDKEWYIKDLAHFDVSGSLKQLMHFLETIQKSSYMITISGVTMTRLSDDVYQMVFDAGFVMVKKEKTL